MLGAHGGNDLVSLEMDHNLAVNATWAFLRLSRPHFLAGGALMYAVGAFSVGVSNLGDYLLGQAMVTSAQITAHFVNEYADVDVDRLVSNRTFFSGGSGVLAKAELDPRVALRAAQVASILALGFTAGVAASSPAAAIVGLAALAVSWAYSMPPARILDTGWGELATSAVVTVGVPVVGALVQGGRVGTGLVATMAALLPVHVAMMLAFELPDLEADRAAGKTVVAVRIGATRTKRLVRLLLAASASTIGVAIASGALSGEAGWVAIAALVPASLTVWAMYRDRFQVLTTSAVASLVVLGAGLLVVG